MATYTYDITNDIGKVRLFINDKDIVPTTDAEFSDEEIQVFIDMAGGNLYLASALALESWAATETSSMDAEKIGDYSYNRGSANKKLTLAKGYRDMYENAPPAFAWSEYDLTGIEDVT